MATESVNRPAHRGLTLHDVDAAHELIEKAMGSRTLSASLQRRRNLPGMHLWRAPAGL